ncbi:uncharacterized protein PODANS_1_5800 [Podospora anserina S mat+]|uniref:Podospora anserina S mat+ genomic DNA chromosome 1, supercontig 1 n=5 Tax=Podospora TaxID=5144 RepID=B2AB10_PODAN|nr:uncharacterized protein PODANS_1_5800 [Podospora anserina S mat+]KAK4647943.1 hypothetical protein QC761_105800 [Podospora bellae-mahoneyi]KAK4658923.1 hypothetical protein QC762_105800 [Podospora pseudocomata]KAK4672751.1 hypothetical protein QC763_105800 [Podospora pseudopauciseta]KAK4681251.1 hypothetical protein QC764_105800 [Podospora pseudoanserina]CAP60272.1 unnamed protein product [Podospora anserina S mat+]
MPSSNFSSSSSSTAAGEKSRIPPDYEWKYHSGHESSRLCSCKTCSCGAAVPYAGDLCDDCSKPH